MLAFLSCVCVCMFFVVAGAVSSVISAELAGIVQSTWYVKFWAIEYMVSDCDDTVKHSNDKKNASADWNDKHYDLSWVGVGSGRL